MSAAPVWLAPDYNRTSPIIIDRALVLRWAERVEAAIDNPPECIDLLLDLAEDLDTVLVSA